jgi:membrane protease subunit HflK
VVPEARGQAEQLIRESEAYRERLIKEAEGEAERFNFVYDSYKISPDVVRTRMYFDVMGEVLSKSNKVIIDQGADGENGVVPYLPLPEVQKRK